MRNALEAGSPGVRAAWWRRKPPGGVAGAAFWLAVGSGLIWLVRQVPSGGSALLGWMQLLAGLALIALAFPLAWRLVRTRLLWSLRSKLILTYLLIGLAPVLLVGTFAAISVYIAAGQFSIHLADSRMRQELDELGVEDAARASGMARMMRARAEGLMGPPPPGRFVPRRPPGASARPTAQSARAAVGAGTATSEAAAQSAAAEATQATTLSEALPDPLRARLHPHTTMYVNGAPAPTLGGLPPGVAGQNAPARTPLGLPPWAADMHDKEVRALVLDGENLYLVAIDQRRVEGGVLVTAVTSLPVDGALLDVVAKGLGRVELAGLMTGGPAAAPAVAPAVGAGAANSGEGAAVRVGARRIEVRDLERASVYGGTEPPPVYFSDLRVPFVSTLDTIDWDTGQSDVVSTTIRVHSRPSLLYKQLFGSSLGGIVTSYIRYGLVALCIVFAIIEALALWMALRLSGTITASVHELYEATQRVDRGDFQHRIPASSSGQQDQLGELALSFNRMTGSMERLLVEQKEKERLQSELSIAQEVQANLFPNRTRNLPKLELHGICRPARTVSGDYYDFLIFHHEGGDAHAKDKSTRGEHGSNGDGHGVAVGNGHAGMASGVGIVLGDISGKGISAALLMATLHSAVRAYQFASEDLIYSESSLAGLTVSREALAGDSGKLFESPGRILSLLNRHLYRSTQAEKYATLFLAHYDAATAQLTYSNAGHLPPLVLGRDGKIRRLDCGGTVVGLIDGMRYEEGHIQMNSGDILVAYSDGVTEPENDFGDFGEARMMEIVARYRDQPLSVISAQVMLALDTWIGDAEQPDDITLVLARQA